jgi:flagellar hook-associated protein 2
MSVGFSILKVVNKMPISLGGFSGINTDQMIQQLMYIERKPIRRMEESKSEINNQIDAWQKINTGLDTLKNKALDLDGVFAEMSAASSDESILTASATENATSGTYDIDVTQLAQAHRVASDSAETITGNTGDDANTALNLTADGTFTISAGGTNIQVGDETSIDSNTSLNDLADLINNDNDNTDGDGNDLVKASIIDNKLVLESAKSGSSNELSIVQDPNSVLSDIGFTDLVNDDQIKAAQDAKFTVNGLSISRESNTVDDVIEGVTLDLKDSGASTLTVDGDKEQVKEKIKGFVEQYNKLQDKLGKYGGKEGVLQGDGTLGNIGSAISNSVVYPSATVSSTDWLNSTPLSWESGTEKNLSVNGTDVSLDGGDDLEAIKDKINNNVSGVTATVESNRIAIKGDDGSPPDLSGSSSRALRDLKLPETFEKNTASLLGIEINKDGKLSVNSDKLDDALENNSSDLQQMFTGVNGIMERVEEEVDIATDSFDGYVENRIDTLNNEIDYLNDDIASTERRLELRRANLQRKFANMEQMVSTFQNQQQQLSSQIGSLGL